MKRHRQGVAEFIPRHALSDVLDSLESLRSQDEMVKRLVTLELEPLFFFEHSEG